MPQKTDGQLTTQANEIKNETDAGDNTATRVGQMYIDIIDSKANNSALSAEEAARIAADALKAPIASPTFTGTPAVPTAAPGTNTTQVASTAFVTAAIAAGGGGADWGDIGGDIGDQSDLQAALAAVNSNAGGQAAFSTISPVTVGLTATFNCASKRMSNFRLTQSVNFTAAFTNLSEGDEAFVELTSTANIQITFDANTTIFYNSPISGVSTTLAGASSTSVYHIGIKKTSASVYSAIIQQMKT